MLVTYISFLSIEFFQWLSYILFVTSLARLDCTTQEICYMMCIMGDMLQEMYHRGHTVRDVSWDHVMGDV